MADLRRAARALGRLLVQALTAALALLALLSLWVLGDLPAGPNAPEQAGAFAWLFVLVWRSSTALLAVLVIAELLVGGYRRWATAGIQALRWPTARLVVEAVVGGAIVAVAPPLQAVGGSLRLFALAALAWTVLVHRAVDLIRYSRERLGRG